LHCIGCNNKVPSEARFCPRCGLSLRPSQNDPFLGKKLDNRYLVLEQLGEGGSGKVYLARHVNLGKRVVIKVLHRELLQDEKAVKRFRKEALSVSNLENSHIIKVFDLGETDNGSMYIAMEHLTGETLAARMVSQGRLPYKTVCSIISQLCDGLMEAHAMGFIHRDLRPRNIMFTKHDNSDSFIKILDFGMAKIVTGGPDPSKSAIGFSLGDPTYTAPEQMKAKPLDAKTDIYSLGIITFHALSGYPPFTGRNILEIMAAHLDSPAPLLEGTIEGLPKGIDQIISKAIAKDPQHRFSTVFQLKDALNNLINGAVVPTSGKTKDINPSMSYLSLEKPHGIENGASIIRVPGGGVVRMEAGEVMKSLANYQAPVPVESKVIPVPQDSPKPIKEIHLPDRDIDPNSTMKVNYNDTTHSHRLKTAIIPDENSKNAAKYNRFGISNEQTPSPRDSDRYKDHLPPEQQAPAPTMVNKPHSHKDKAAVLLGIAAPQMGAITTKQLESVKEDDPPTEKEYQPNESIISAGPSQSFIAHQDELIIERDVKAKKERTFWLLIICGGAVVAVLLYLGITHLSKDTSSKMEYSKTNTKTADTPPSSDKGQIPPEKDPPLVVKKPEVKNPEVKNPDVKNPDVVPPSMDTVKIPTDKQPPQVKNSTTTKPPMKTTVNSMKAMNSTPSMTSIMIPEIKIPSNTTSLKEQIAKANKLKNSGDYKKAYKAFKSLASRNSSSYTILMGLASTSFELGKNSEAEKALLKAVKVRRSSYRAWYKLGNIRKKLGKKAKAKAAYRKSLSINPKYKAARKALNRLSGIKNPDF
jgi:serine/threonine protein kinase